MTKISSNSSKYPVAGSTSRTFATARSARRTNHPFLRPEHEWTTKQSAYKCQRLLLSMLRGIQTWVLARPVKALD